MGLRLTIFDKKRGCLILTSKPFDSIDYLTHFANDFIIGIISDLILYVTDDKNQDIGYLSQTPNGFKPINRYGVEINDDMIEDERSNNDLQNKKGRF